MRVRRSKLSWALRASAAVASGAAVGILLQRPPGDTRPATAATVVPSTMDAAAPLATAVAAATREPWTLQTNGWRIRIADVAPPAPEVAAVPSESVQTVATDIYGPPMPVRTPLISQYDDLIVRHAAAEGFDWRLIAAVVGEESGFEPTSRSEKGAYGLMQIMPIAAQAVGMENFSEPEDNVRTGVLYLRQLNQMFRQARGMDRLKLVLAAYNMGPGHLQDAQILAEELGNDPNVWDNEMEAIIPLLEDPEYYEYLPNGFARGRDVVRYVYRVLDRYDRYQVLTAQAEARERAATAAANKAARARRRG